MALAQYFLQKLAINGAEIDRAVVLSCCYMEMLDMEGPQIEIDLRDPTGRLVDNLGIRYGSTLVCTLGDSTGQLAMWQETFFIVEAPNRNDVISISALAATVRNLHAPAPKAQFFKDQQPADVLTALAPDLSASADSFNLTGTYHLNNGELPVSVVRKMAQDNGAVAWVSHNVISVKGINNLLDSPPSFSYEANNPKANLRMNKWQLLNADYATSKDHDYRYVGFSETEGTVSAGGDNLPVKMVSDTDAIALQNKTLALIPKLDMECDGNAALSVGQVVQIGVRRYDNENTLDESIPKYLIVMRVTQFETRFNFRTRAILGTTYDQIKGLEGMSGGGALGGAKAFEGATGFDLDGFDLGGFLGKLSEGVESGLGSLNELVNQVSDTVKDVQNTVDDAIKDGSSAINEALNGKPGGNP